MKIFFDKDTTMQQAFRFIGENIKPKVDFQGFKRIRSFVDGSVLIEV